nr:MAG TPA: hypothetical protein [Caudoviricetes sp.]
MNFKTFNVATTNIFPMANGAGPGSLMSEFNLRSRESVATPANIKYFIGPSYTHGPDDFKLSIQTDDDTQVSSSVLMISEGRALINGHYVETLAPMVVDLLEANAIAKKNKLDPLKGKLVVGLRVMYSTKATMAGAILPVDDKDIYEGVQVVILPEDKFRLPIDVPNEEDKVTAHIRLGTFNFINGAISSIQNNIPGKYQTVDASRISNVDDLISEGYISKTGLNPNKLYTFAGKGTDPSTGLDTWCDSTDSLMVWDKTPTLVTDKPDVTEAIFQVDASTRAVKLVIPHKQVDGVKKTDGTLQYYKDRQIKLPIADYATGGSGTVDANYTKHIKQVAETINNFYHMPAGKQVDYIDILNTVDDLPPINAAWKVGDYILVNQDNTQDTSTDTSKAPATMYVILPGTIQSVKYFSKFAPNKDAVLTYNGAGDNENIYCLADQCFYTIKSHTLLTKAPTDWANDYTKYFTLNSGLYYTVPKSSIPPEFESDTYYSVTVAKGSASALTGVQVGIEYISDIPNTGNSSDDITEQNNMFGIPKSEYRGVVDSDYLIAELSDKENRISRYCYKVQTADKYQYSTPVMITGSIPLAQETVVGGFLNVPDTAVDGGYIIRDENGHLRLIDYSLLRSGVLAYQLGEDFETPAGVDIPTIQTYLDEYVNYRVAFKDTNTIAESNSDPYVINVTINLPDASDKDEETTLLIRGIDSRFNTSVYLHIKGGADSKTTINIMDCEKLRIDSNIEGTPKLNLYRSNLYYDSSVINYFTKIDDMKLWYERYSNDDPDLLVDNMTVTELNAPIISEDIDIWSLEVPNDNHFTYALKSLTFGRSGEIVGCEMYIRNDMSNNIEEGRYVIVSKFSLPEGQGLQYPAKRLTKQLKITGSFVTCYPTTSPAGYMMTSTEFTALSQAVDEYTLDPKLSGVISLLCNVFSIDRVVGVDLGTQIDGWQSNSFHIFSGGVVG